MYVISKINTKKLVKGSKYKVYRIKNLRMPNKYFYACVYIKLNDNSSSNISMFRPNSFVLEDGSSIPEINWDSEEFKSQFELYNETKIDQNTKIGDYVVYVNNTHKSFVYNKKYKISDIHIIGDPQNPNIFYDIHIKLEGMNRWYKHRSFRKCSLGEIREITLNVMTDEKTIDELVEKVNKKVRKIDLYDEKEKEKTLLRTLTISALDRDRNNLSILEWAIQKIGKKLSLKESDFNNILKDDSVLKLLNKL